MHSVPASVQNYQKLLSKIQTSSKLNVSQHHQNTNTAEAYVPESQPDNTGCLILSLPIPGRVYDVTQHIWEWQNPAPCEMQTGVSVKAVAGSDPPSKKMQEKMKLLEQSCRPSLVWAPGAERFHRARWTATREAVRRRKLQHSLSLPCLWPTCPLLFPGISLSQALALSCPTTQHRVGGGCVANAHQVVSLGACLPRTLPLT